MDIYDLMKQVNDAFNQRYCFSSKRKNSKRYGFTILDNSSLMEKAKISHALYRIVSVYFLEVCQATWHL